MCYRLLCHLPKSRMILEKLGTIFVKRLLKALAMFLEFLTSLPFAVITLGCLLLLYLNVTGCQIPFQIKNMSFLSSFEVIVF